MRLSLPASILISSAMVSGALLLLAATQRYAFVGSGSDAVKLDRLTGATVVCVVQPGPRTRDNHRTMIAPCDGSMP